MVWPPDVKNRVWEGNREDGVVFDSKNLLLCDKGHEKKTI